LGDNACRDARGRDNLPASGLICPDPVALPLRRITRTVGPRASIAQGDEDLKAGRTQYEISGYNTQSESQPATQPSLNSRRMQSYARTNYRVHQPTTRVIQSELSSASLNYGKDVARTKTMSHDDVQFQRRLSLLETTNQQVRLMSPKVFYNSWIQEHQDTRTRTPTTNKKPLLETLDDVETVDADSRNANRTSTPQRSRHELSEIEQTPSMVASESTAASSVEKSNPSTNDENLAVSIIVHNQPVAHNATVSEFAQHELDSLTPTTLNAITTEFAQHELSNPTNVPNPATLHNHENSLRNSDTMGTEQQEESEMHNSSSPQFALSIANFTMKPVRHSSNETSSRSTVPTITSESYGEANEEITPTDTEWARTQTPKVV